MTGAMAGATTGGPDAGAPNGQGGGEFSRIDRFFRPLAAGFPGACDLRDDAGYITVPPGQELVVTTDALVAGVHFLPDDPPDLIAAKLLRTNLSDLAAKGADPLAYSLVTTLPTGTTDAWLEAFCQGLAQDQARYAIHLLGGDTVSTSGPLVLAVSALGLVPQGRAVRRDGARPGDIVYVSGSIGDATLGLRLVLPGAPPPPADIDADEAAFLIARLRKPEPRLPLARPLRAIATAAADVSDGLLADLGHIAQSSRCRAVLELERVPLSAPARRALACGWVTGRDLVTGGDDYEIVFTAPPSQGERLAQLAQELGLPLTPVGRIEALGEGDTPGARLLEGGRDVTPARTGWQHL